MLDAKRSKILNISIAISCFTHAAFVVFLQAHSLWFSAPVSVPKGAHARSKIIEKTSSNEILREAFALAKEEKAVFPSVPKKEEFTYQFTQPSIANLEPLPSFCSFPVLPMEEFLTHQSAMFPIRTFQLPSIEQFDFFADLPKDLIVPTIKERAAAATFKPQAETTASRMKTAEVVLDSPTSTTIAFANVVTDALPSGETMVKAVPTIPVPNLPHLPSLADLQTVNLSDSFDAELSFLPRSDGPGYIFALTLLPQKDLNLPKIKQNVIFLVDKSNSIQKDRLQATKHAICRALEELNADVQFNVIAFDAKMEKLFPSLVSQTSDATAKAGKFIDNISLGSMFSVADIYKALFLTIPSRVQEDELYTAILLTDGESLSKKNTRRSFLRDWTLQNDGRVSLYAVGIDGDPNFPSLDAACAMNKGKYITASTNRGLKRKLTKLAKNIRSPVAKNVVSRAVAQNPRSHVEIHLNSAHAPHLYLDEPYVILGTTDTLDDFIVFVQGNLKNGWLNIKKTISFADARKGGESLQSQWALQNAYRNYEQYVQDDNPNHLVEAKKLLEPFNIQSIQ